MAIFFKDKEIPLIYFGKKPIEAIYYGATLVWQAISSCFDGGYWINDKGWKNEAGWKNIN